MWPVTVSYNNAIDRDLMQPLVSRQSYIVPTLTIYNVCFFSTIPAQQREVFQCNMTYNLTDQLCSYAL